MTARLPGLNLALEPGTSTPVVLALLAVLLLLVASPFLVRRWPLALLVFLAWLSVEDLLRKLAGNDLRIYFIKDLFYLVLLLAVFMSAQWRGAWESATGRTRYALYVLVLWALLVSVPAVMVDWRLPVLGLRLDFFYLPLVIMGYLIARDPVLRVRVVLGASLIAGAACAVGSVQAFLGPSFLAPTVETPGLINLVLTRGFLGHPVYRPTGTFVDPGRFDAYAVSALALSLAAVFLIRSKWRFVPILMTVISAFAVWLSGGRTGLVAGILLVIAAIAGWLWGRHRLPRQTWLVIPAVAVVAGIVAIARPNQLGWYWKTLNPFSPDNEWMFRLKSYGIDTLRGILSGGLFGLGPGHESLGKQYIFGGPEYLIPGLYSVEGGYAGVAVELGLIGLIFWLLWTVVWTTRLWQQLSRMHSEDRAAGLVLFAWVAFFLFPSFFSGLQSFQNYTANAYFWLFSGLIFGLPQLAPARSKVRAHARPRVWVVSPEVHTAGGTEYAVAQQLTGWRERFELQLYTTKFEGVDLPGVVVRRIPAIPGPVLVRYLWWFAANAVVRWFDAKRHGPPDVVFSPGVNALDARAIGVHIVFGKYWERVRGKLGRSLRDANRVVWWAFIRRLEARVYSGPATLWAASNEDARELERRFGRPAGSVPVVPHGVDTKRFSPAERKKRRAAARARLGLGDTKVGLLIGNDIYKKGADTAIGALSQLPWDVVLAVAGNLDTAVVWDLARSHGVADRVKVWPHTNEVVDYYAAADFFLAPSREDAFHMPALEALACELPLVVSKSAGVADLLTDDRNALLMNDAEDPAELARLVTRLLDGQIAQRLAREGRALAERCSWEANAAATATLIEREMNTPRVLVLSNDATSQVTGTLVSALEDLYGAERIRVLRGSKLAITTAKKMRHRNLLLIATHVRLAHMARVAAEISGARYAVWCHGREAWGPMTSNVKVALQNAAAVFASNAFTASRVEHQAELASGSVTVFPYGLASVTPSTRVGERGGERGDEITVLAAARLASKDAYNGIDTLICAWSQVSARVPEAQLEIAGDGPDRRRLMTMADTLSLNGTVRFIGRISDIDLNHAYARARVFTLPGRHSLGAPGDAFGMAFVEAGAAGLPVVAGAEASEAVADEESGLLVNTNDPKDVADAIVRLLTDSELARKLGRGGQERAEGMFAYATFKDHINAMVTSALGEAARQAGPQK